MERRRSAILALLAVAAAVTAAPAMGETSTIRIGRQVGLGYLQVYVMQEQKLIEKHARALGLGGLTATYQPIPNPTGLNEALLSGSIDIVAGGPPPFITIWDRTRGNANVKAVAALGNQPLYLVTNNPRIKSLRDYTDNDRIAVPAPKTSTQAILLQMAAESMYGAAQWEHFDGMTLALPHPDAVAALLAGHNDVQSHFSSIPYQEQELADPKVHRVASSYDMTGGPSIITVLWATSRFHDGNPKAYRALLDALQDATDFINANHAEAARIFIKIEHSKLSQDAVESILASPEVTFTLTPDKIMKFADFMARRGQIRKRPDNWQELFFPEAHVLQGS